MIAASVRYIATRWRCSALSLHVSLVHIVVEAAIPIRRSSAGRSGRRTVAVTKSSSCGGDAVRLGEAIPRRSPRSDLKRNVYTHGSHNG